MPRRHIYRSAEEQKVFDEARRVRRRAAQRARRQAQRAAEKEAPLLQVTVEPESLPMLGPILPERLC